MKQILPPLMLYLLALTATPITDAFLSPTHTYTRRSRHVIASARRSYKHSRRTMTPAPLKSDATNKHTYLKQSPSDAHADPSNTINIAIFSNDENDDFQTTLLDHPFRKMTGVSLSIDYIPTTTQSTLWSTSELRILQNTDIVCFPTASAVRRYLKKLDEHLNVPTEISQEERRKLPNKPDFIADIMQDAGGARGDALMAACPSGDIARECLNCGRWRANHIYYPKDGNAVQLKTESLLEVEEYDESEDAQEDLDINVDVWAASVMQAAGDVMERKFWGGGW
ncbi:hypothetical protein ACHAWX_007705 [Stephanocyclus meneghinianus]